MKFENDYFKIEIIKKELSEEQKQEKKRKLVKRLPVLTTIFALVLCLIVVFNKKNNNKRDAKLATDTDATYMSSIDLAAATKNKYGENNSFSYGNPIDDIARGDKIKIKVGYDVKSLPVEYWSEIYEIYMDPMLTESFPIDYDWNKDNKEVIISPYSRSINLVSTFDVDTGVVSKYPHSDICFFDKGDGKDWGNQRNLYLACYYDEETGEKLDKPVVRIITIKGELEDNPVLQYTITNEGQLSLRWSEVKDASIYMICEAVREKNGFISTMNPIGYTTDLKWETELPTLQEQYMNTKMKYFDFGENDWLADMASDELLEKFKNEYKEEYEAKGVINYLRTYEGKYLCVIAMSDAGTSMTSNMIDYDILSSNLPYSTSYGFEEANGFKTHCMSIEEIPIYDYVEMCDGRVLNKLIDYKTEDATVTNAHYYSFNDDGEVDGREDLICLKIPYAVEGTAFLGTVTVDYYDETSFEEDMKNIEIREDLIRMKGGNISPEASTDFETSSLDAKEVAVNEDNKVYATNALSEYIAINLLAGNLKIDVSEFKEAKDYNLLKDAFFEAYYQNPLVFGINSYMISSKCDYIFVKYDYSIEEQSKMQREVREKTATITKEIIKDGMTDEEKEIAINEYLCSHVVYDNDALESVQKNNYKEVSNEFLNSFNAYGAIVDGRCVCQGYAGAFKLLAEAAGLESIVVSGMLDGEIPHAWNKVKINGKWCIIDTTNNDNEFLSNALFNIPDEVANKVLVEDEEYILDTHIDDYVNDNTEYEYYHITDNYYDIAKVANEIIDELKVADGKKVVIRTDYSMTDDDFALICSVIYDEFGDKVSLHGCHWLGVICVY